PGWVKVRLRDGRALEAREESQRGGPDRPIAPDEVIGKFRENASRVIPADRVTEIERAVLGLGGAPVMGAVGVLCRVQWPPWHCNCLGLHADRTWLRREDTGGRTFTCMGARYLGHYLHGFPEVGLRIDPGVAAPERRRGVGSIGAVDAAGPRALQAAGRRD